MKRMLSVFITLCFIVIGLVSITTSTPSRAITTWPMQLENIRVTNVTGYSNGSFAAVACSGSYPNGKGVTFFDKEGNPRSTLSGPLSSQLYCDGADNSQVFADGTVYATKQPTATTTELVAWKNSRQLWSFNSTSPTKCPYYGSYVDKQMMPSSISEGNDGNVYMILSSGYEPRNCDDRLVGLNKKTGTVIFDQAIGKGPGPGSGLGSTQPQAWTYDSKIVVVDRGGMIREFSYAGVEDTGAQYQFPIPSGHTIEHTRANAEGTVFAMTRAVSVSGYATLLYHKDNDTTGSIEDTYSMYGSVSQLYLTSNGSVVGIEPSTRRVDRFDLVNNAVLPSSNIANNTTYPVAGLIGYVEDENGNALAAWSYSSTNGVNQAVSVDEIAAGTGVRTNLLFEESVSAGSNGPNLYPFGHLIDRSIADNSLYIPVCESGAATCFSETTAPDISIFKAELVDFGTPLKNDYKRNGYQSDKPEYVAMGDSFASGEGAGPFLLGTDTDSPNENRCHRSEDAYPLLLEEDTDLNLTAFVACSGAVTANINGPGQWESKQIDALSERVDIVTLSIGGNDVGMIEFATECVQHSCDEYTVTYGETIARINSLDTELEDVYTSILDKLPEDGLLYVTDYPMIAPMDMAPTDLVVSGSALCLAMYDGSIIGGTVENPLYNHWGNARAAQNVIASLNSKIELAVYNVWLTDPRIHFVDISSSLESHDVCSTSPYFYVYSAPPATFHPDDSAHGIFESILLEEIE